MTTDNKPTVESRMVLLSTEIEAVLIAWNRPVPVAAIRLCLNRVWNDHTVRVALHWLLQEGRIRKIPDLRDSMAAVLYLRRD